LLSLFAWTPRTKTLPLDPRIPSPPASLILVSSPHIYHASLCQDWKRAPFPPGGPFPQSPPIGCDRGLPPLLFAPGKPLGFTSFDFSGFLNSSRPQTVFFPPLGGPLLLDGRFSPLSNHYFQRISPFSTDGFPGVVTPLPDRSLLNLEACLLFPREGRFSPFFFRPTKLLILGVPVSRFLFFSLRSVQRFLFFFSLYRPSWLFLFRVGLMRPFFPQGLSFFR